MRIDRRQYGGYGSSGNYDDTSSYATASSPTSYTTTYTPPYTSTALVILTTPPPPASSSDPMVVSSTMRSTTALPASASSSSSSTAIQTWANDVSSSAPAATSISASSGGSSNMTVIVPGVIAVVAAIIIGAIIACCVRVRRRRRAGLRAAEPVMIERNPYTVNLASSTTLPSYRTTRTDTRMSIMTDTTALGMDGSTVTRTLSTANSDADSITDSESPLNHPAYTYVSPPSRSGPVGSGSSGSDSSPATTVGTWRQSPIVTPERAALSPIVANGLGLARGLNPFADPSPPSSDSSLSANTFGVQQSPALRVDTNVSQRWQQPISATSTSSSWARPPPTDETDSSPPPSYIDLERR